jgi:hypothetical protein
VATLVAALRFAWSVLWRAQAAHLAVFVAIPLLATLARVGLGLVLLPFLILGPGNRDESFGAELAHLKRPGCLVMLASCPLADRALSALPVDPPPEAAPELAPYGPPEPEPFLAVPQSFTVRHLWLLLWLGSLVIFLVRRERRRKLR